MNSTKTTYVDLMERVLSAYSEAHIREYFTRVQTEGLSEHGFPRLTANIGILIAHGRCRELLPLFRQMMEFCCQSIPKVLAANDFSVREIVCCLWELERAQVVSREELAHWKDLLTTIEPEKCYNKFAKNPTDPVRNWALFTGVSEFYRQKAGLCHSEEFIETQIASQLQWLDENGMYRDNAKAETYQPVVYDLAPRGLFCFLLHAGYRGRYFAEVDACLRKANLLTLKMQSVTGELAYGGRSNQFLHNEAWLAGIFEFEAARYYREGDLQLAGKFKAAANRALEPMHRWLEEPTIRHVKNRFPLESKFGCEGYAYFDKYMITAASFLYAAYLFCDEAVPVGEFDDSPCAWQTSAYFHKIFLRAGGYSLEFDLNGDPQYDACGLGRVHRYGAPSALCLSVPCPRAPHYSVVPETPLSMSLCAGKLVGGIPAFTAEPGTLYQAEDLCQGEDHAAVTLLNPTEGLKTHYRVDQNGVSIRLNGEGALAYLLPALLTDGEKQPEIQRTENTLTVAYGGWVCRYTANGPIRDAGFKAPNRNGIYQAFYATAENELELKIELVPQ